MQTVHRVDKYIELAEWLAFECGNPELALEWIQKAAIEEPDNPQALTVMGDVLQDLERYDAALVYYDQALELDAEAVDAMAEKAQTLCLLMRWKEAIEAADHGLKTVEELKDAINSAPWQATEETLIDAKAHALFELGDRAGSILVLRDGLARYPESEALLGPLRQILTNTVRRVSDSR